MVGRNCAMVHVHATIFLTDIFLTVSRFMGVVLPALLFFKIRIHLVLPISAQMHFLLFCANVVLLLFALLVYIKDALFYHVLHQRLGIYGSSTIIF